MSWAGTLHLLCRCTFVSLFDQSTREKRGILVHTFLHRLCVGVLIRTICAGEHGCSLTVQELYRFGFIPAERPVMDCHCDDTKSGRDADDEEMHSRYAAPIVTQQQVRQGGTDGRSSDCRGVL